MLHYAKKGKPWNFLNIWHFQVKRHKCKPPSLPCNEYVTKNFVEHMPLREKDSVV